MSEQTNPKNQERVKVRLIRDINHTLGILVDKDDLINYQLLIVYGLLLRIFTYQPTVDKTILISTNC